MRIGYILKRFPVFAQTFVVREIEGLFKYGLNPIIFSLQKPHDTNSQEGFKQIEEKVLFLPSKFRLSAEILHLAIKGLIPLPYLVKYPWWSRKNRAIKEALWIYPNLKKFQIQHLHSHFLGPATETQWWLKKMFDINYSFTAHANDFLANQATQSLANKLMCDAKFVVAVSEYSKGCIEKNFPKANIVKIYNGMSYDLFSKTTPENPPQLISIGRLVEKKGFEILIDACNILNKQNIAFQCEIIGDGPLRESLERKIDSIGLKSKIFLSGAKSQDIIRGRLAAGSVFVLACVPEKNGGMDILPTVIMEAMGARLPVVSTTLAGIPEMVLHEKTGLLVEPFDAVGLAESIEKILKKPHHGKIFGEEGYKRARELFDESITIPRLIEMFNS